MSTTGMQSSVGGIVKPFHKKCLSNINVLEVRLGYLLLYFILFIPLAFVSMRVFVCVGVCVSVRWQGERPSYFST